MKKFFALSAMCATLIAATSCGGGEKNEPVEPAEEPTVWSDINVFDTNGDETGKEVTNYGQDGKIVSVDKYTVDKESKQMVQTDHVIYQNGKPAFGKALRADASLEGRDLYTYNEQGLLTEEVVETYSEGLKRIAPAQRFVYAYDANGDVTSIKEQKAVPNGWATEYEWTYTYDAQGRLTGRADYTGDGKDRKQSCQYGWSYEDGSNKIKQLDYFTFDLKQQKLKHDSKTRYTYNAAGQVETATVIRHKANQKRDDINSRLITNRYNAAGQLLNVIEQKWNNGSSSWYEVASSNYEYDEAGQLTRYASIKNTNKGVKVYNQVHTLNAPAGQLNVAPAAEALVVKPVINLDDKHATSKDEE
ncbi:MAG: hypothetical protein KBT20_02600 [Bacteroidales bacterium]|nr:hypothetical protein [Candidatus Liminaster caballi]